MASSDSRSTDHLGFGIPRCRTRWNPLMREVLVHRITRLAGARRVDGRHATTLRIAFQLWTVGAAIAKTREITQRNGDANREQRVRRERQRPDVPCLYTDKWPASDSPNRARCPVSNRRDP